MKMFYNDDIKYLKETIKKLKKTICSFKYTYYYIKFTNNEMLDFIENDFNKVFDCFKYELRVYNFMLEFLKKGSITDSEYEKIYNIIDSIKNLNEFNTNTINEITRKVKSYKSCYVYVSNYNDNYNFNKNKEYIDEIIKKLENN